MIFDGINQDFFNKHPSIDEETVEIMGESLSCPLIVEPHMKVLSYATRGNGNTA